MLFFYSFSFFFIITLNAFAIPQNPLIDCNTYLSPNDLNRTINLNKIEAEDSSIDKFQDLFTKTSLSEAEILNAIERRQNDINKILKHVSNDVQKSKKLHEAIKYYSIWYDQINIPLRSNKSPTGIAGKHYKILSSSTFKDLPRVEGIVFRATILKNEIFQKILQDKVYLDLGYLSASLKPQSALAYIDNIGKLEESENVLMLIQSSNGRYIAPLSELPKEEEVLFSSGTKFALQKVISQEKETRFKILLFREL
jgi:hypothetical protein